MEEIELMELREPVSIDGVIIGLAVAALAGMMCYYTWARPDLLNAVFNLDQIGAEGSIGKFVLNMVYNRVTGTIAGVLSLLVLFGTLTTNNSTRQYSG